MPDLLPKQLAYFVGVMPDSPVIPDPSDIISRQQGLNGCASRPVIIRFGMRVICGTNINLRVQLGHSGGGSASNE
jgi:hypothetical protein